VKATIKPRINLDERTKLETVIPLSTPLTLFIDPSSGCNFRCKFCPNGDPKLIRSTGRYQGIMDFAVYRKIIDDLKEFEKPLKVLRLYKDGEPFLNPHLADMVAYAKQQGVAQAIDTTTNGSLLTMQRVKPVIDAGIDRINISVDGLSNEQFLEFARVKVDFQAFVENIMRLYEIRGNCQIFVKIAGDFLSEEEKQFFYATFGDCADQIFIENVAPCWPQFDVAEKLDVHFEKGIYNQPVSEVSTCPYIFYSLSINADGLVSLCFLDWARKLILGDCRIEKIKDIWLGEKLHNYRVLHLEGRRKEHPICGVCGQMSHGLPDNIDPFAVEILERLTARKR
jgi:MoaA/NifB/PqqE/SkfB family radical SAM enzyme